jgi:hypothetical protein
MPKTGRVGLTADASREEVAACVDREGGPGSDVRLELECEAAEGPIALGPGALRGRLELPIERRIVEMRKVRTAQARFRSPVNIPRTQTGSVLAKYHPETARSYGSPRRLMLAKKSPSGISLT